MEEKQNIRAMIRVNQAGEYGAVQIYRGQQAILKNTSLGTTLQEMQSHEEEHLRRFNELLLKHQVRPTLLSPLWRLAGFSLGALTACLGHRAALACTVAVEEVIEAHYEEQKQLLSKTTEPPLTELREAIEECQQEEVLHKNIAIDLGAKETPFYQTLTFAIKGLTRGAIWLSKRL